MRIDACLSFGKVTAGFVFDETFIDSFHKYFAFDAARRNRVSFVEREEEKRLSKELEANVAR